jgi:hypothetical protein
MKNFKTVVFLGFLFVLFTAGQEEVVAQTADRSYYIEGILCLSGP